jgi:hypothetical protein
MAGLAAGAAGVVGAATFGLTSGSEPHPEAHPGPAPRKPHRPQEPPVRLIGDGSTADTGEQPHQPPPPGPMEPGQKPPQFVIFSWDGAGELGSRASARSPPTTARR